jgi:hypothetical protein
MSNAQQRFLRWLTHIGFGLTLLVGGLQMYRFPAGFLTNYGGDIAGPLFLYGAMRRGKTVFHHFTQRVPGPAVSAILLFVACAAWEFCQLFDLSGTPLVITRGHFDPFDLLAYAGTVIACYLGDRCFSTTGSPNREG